MLEDIYSLRADAVGINGNNGDKPEETAMIKDLKGWYHLAHKTRTGLLHCIAIGLGMADAGSLVGLNDGDNNLLHLLKYFPGDASTGNRCREHSNYGTLTLLLTDGMGGLEAYVDNKDVNNCGGGGGGGIRGAIVEAGAPRGGCNHGEYWVVAQQLEGGVAECDAPPRCRSHVCQSHWRCH
jgi:hypothetical protein